MTLLSTTGGVGHGVVPHDPVPHVPEVQVVTGCEVRILAPCEEAKRNAPRNMACSLTIRRFYVIMEFYKNPSI